MYQCPLGSFQYIIQLGDNLWKLAHRYNTSVEAIVAMNPTINPYWIYVGQVICIPIKYRISKSELDLRNKMRELWEQHVAWTRMAIISMASDSEDLDLVSERLLRNALDFKRALKPIYGEGISTKFADLLREHLVIAAELVKAAKAGDTVVVADAEKRWYDNADGIATFLSSINPNWSKEDLRTMLYNHLALTKAEAVARLSNDYAKDIEIYDKIEAQALEMADALSDGIVKQFIF